MKPFTHSKRNSSLHYPLSYFISSYLGFPLFIFHFPSLHTLHAYMHIILFKYLFLYLCTFMVYYVYGTCMVDGKK